MPAIQAWVINALRRHHLENLSLDDIAGRRCATSQFRIPSWSWASMTIQMFFSELFRPPTMTFHPRHWAIDHQSGILSLRARCAKVLIMTEPQDEDERMCFHSSYEYNLHNVSWFRFSHFRQSPLVKNIKWRPNPASDHDAVGLALLDELITPSDTIFAISLHDRRKTGSSTC
ncbi:uncharacterized protein TRIVIDRAFT_224610 [Trichoderma virens Gv29-8]|uniref:Uncharacterized protein n=1 Tax=Hypocrea virens (strain Gv29-8 / FGSC 10586) TaxID=413071 RepID=G9N0S6_HYPVG|nr:uncharacterized protein TRIVIDRAFT_224610 [Trichoderma virens Gv29-8]EHK19956.1 hypothetical protein TRIVIDRAFT_224610 [Trichoderma virens Gv29-8]UKZ53333.1 hypothetical protein TrVGV298_007125 [Trichoderma virens]